MTTAELDDLAAETACYMSTDAPEYSNLAARIGECAPRSLPAARWRYLPAGH